VEDRSSPEDRRPRTGDPVTARHLRLRPVPACPWTWEPAANQWQAPRGRGVRTWKRGVSALSGDQGGEEADGLGRFLGSKGHEVGLCQLNLLIHVIAGAPVTLEPGVRARLLG
jgi:hypothetical protein